MKLIKITMIVLLCLNVLSLATAVAAEEESMKIVTTTADVEYWLIEN